MCPEDNTTEIKLSDNAQSILEAVEKLTVLELADLVKALEEKFGVSATAPAAAMAAAAPADVEEEMEKTAFTPMLVAIGDQKIKVIKEVRAATDLGLKEAKDFVDGDLPAAIKEDIPEDEAKAIKEALEAVGATIEIK